MSTGQIGLKRCIPKCPGCRFPSRCRSLGLGTRGSLASLPGLLGAFPPWVSRMPPHRLQHVETHGKRHIARATTKQNATSVSLWRNVMRYEFGLTAESCQLALDESDNVRSSLIPCQLQRRCPALASAEKASVTFSSQCFNDGPPQGIQSTAPSSYLILVRHPAQPSVRVFAQHALKLLVSLSHLLWRRTVLPHPLSPPTILHFFTRNFRPILRLPAADIRLLPGRCPARPLPVRGWSLGGRGQWAGQRVTMSRQRIGLPTTVTTQMIENTRCTVRHLTDECRQNGALGSWRERMWRASTALGGRGSLAESLVGGTYHGHG